MNLAAISGAGTRELLAPDSPVRRHYEDLANNLLSMRGAGSIVVTGPEPGVGCTSVCVGIGAALAGMGRRAAVVDCRLDDPRLHRMLGESNFVGLTSCLDGGKPLERYGHEVVPGLLVVPAGPVPPDPASSLEAPAMVEAIRGLQQSRDLVLVDAPAAEVVLRSPNLSGGFDGVLLVVHASRTPRSLARKTADDLIDSGVNLLGAVLNGCA